MQRRPGRGDKERSGPWPVAAGLACACLLQAVPGQAQPWHGSLAATTDYVFRGVSQTSGSAAAQGDLHYEGASGVFAGTWISSINQEFDSYGRFELDLYAGWNWQPSEDWTTRASYVRYLYPDASGSIDYDYGEVSARVAWRDRVVGTVGWSPDMLRFTTDGEPMHGDAYAYEIVVRQPFATRFAVTAGVGYYDQPADVEYWSWSLGAGCQLGPFDLAVTRFGNDEGAREYFGRTATDDRWVFTAAWRF